MERYRDLGGYSGVVAFEISLSTITVQFVSGIHYLYTVQSTGVVCLDKMQRLARAGNGLHTYIMRNAPKSYVRKWRIRKSQELPVLSGPNLTASFR